MPLREDLIELVSPEAPAGEDLYYSPVFEKIREARREEEDSIPEGAWERSQKKKADYRAVIRLAGDALAKQSKDLRLAGWLLEAQLRVDGIAAVLPSIDCIRVLQETFWESLYPRPEEGEGFEMRAIAVEAAARQISQAIVQVPITHNGLSYEDYVESRIVGYEKDADSEAKISARQEAIDANKVTAEDFDSSFASTPKAFYVEAESNLTESLSALDRLDAVQQTLYGDTAPNLSRLRSALESVHGAVEQLLNERRKAEPDPLPAEQAVSASSAAQQEIEAASNGHGSSAELSNLCATSGNISGLAQAYEQVVHSAVFLFERFPSSPVPYLMCAGLRIGETLMQEGVPQPGFAVGPSAEVRQLLRSLAGKGAWRDLLRESLPVLGSPCARAWLDLHRYIWRAGQETGAPAISLAVAGTVKNLLTIRPELRYWTLEDDTGAANPETQRWLDATVLQ